MPSLREYFLTDFKTLSTHFDLTLTRADTSEAVTITARVDYDEECYARFASYFLSQETYSLDLAVLLIANPELGIREADKNVSTTMSHPAIFGSSVVAEKLPFSKRLFLFVDREVSEDDRSELFRHAQAAGLFLEIRDRRYAEYQTKHEKPWAFICHDSREEDDLVRPLANKLASMMCPVWYDELSLKVGDSLRASIDKGLAEAPKCVLVLSRHFLSNTGWSKGELSAAVGKHFAAGGSTLLPVWHGVSRAEVAEYSPLVADIHALRTGGDPDELARKLFVAINPTQ